VPPSISQREFIQQNLDHVAPAAYTLLSCWTRFHKIGKSPVVVWDEAHFGKFASHYLKREFYFDVHPPLGKMLVGLAGLLSGYNGGFEFKSGEAYPDSVPYVAMRVMMATYGVLMVPLGWYTAVELGMSTRACHMVALMCLCGTLLLARHSLKLAPNLARNRCRLVMHIAVHSLGFYVALLHFHHRVWSIKIPQSAVSVGRVP